MSDKKTEEWSDMPLDSRILESIKDLRWTQPTTVQRVCIPLALKGSDVSIQSRTGSGKTGAFVIPVLQRIIVEREKKTSAGGGMMPIGLFLLPSVELCEQITEATNELSKFVKPRVVVDNLTAGGAITTDRLRSCHIAVTTVALLAKVCRSNAITAASLENLRYLVIDEADMIMSIAENSLKVVRSVLPASLQVVLCSATLTDGVASLKGHLLHNPKNIVVSLEDVDAGDDGSADAGPLLERRVTLKDSTESKLKQYYVVATDDCHQNTLLFSLYRMSLLEGKTLIFVNDEDTTYRLQNFLEQLGVAALVYDGTLPMNVRLDTLKRFQKGMVSTLICTDGTLASAEQAQMGLGSADGGEAPPTKRRRTGTSAESSSSSSLHRGIDFSRVRNVILFDGVDATSPLALSRYTHRIGRAARAGEEGLSIAFFSIAQARSQLHLLKQYCASRGERIRPFKQLKRSDAAKLQYRVDSVLSNITRTSTRKLRVSTVAAELSRSSYLSNHMSQKDTDALRRVVRQSQRKVKVEKDLLEVPHYMKIRKVDDVAHYTQRVRSDQTREQKFKKIAKGARVDPLKMVVTNLRKKGKKK